MNERTSKSRFVRVSFPEPVRGQKDWFFGSLKAIYTEFSDEEIGLTLDELYTCIFPAATRKCRIEYVEVARVKQKKNTK